jgi:hypothetical protein
MGCCGIIHRLAIKSSRGAASQRLIPNGRTIWIADARRGDGKRFIVRADEMLTAFLEPEAALRAAEGPEDCGAREIKLDRLSRIK